MANKEVDLETGLGGFHPKPDKEKSGEYYTYDPGLTDDNTPSGTGIIKTRLPGSPDVINKDLSPKTLKGLKGYIGELSRLRNKGREEGYYRVVTDSSDGSTSDIEITRLNKVSGAEYHTKGLEGAGITLGSMSTTSNTWNSKVEGHKNPNLKIAKGTSGTGQNGNSLLAHVEILGGAEKESLSETFLPGELKDNTPVENYTHSVLKNNRFSKSKKLINDYTQYYDDEDKETATFYRAEKPGKNNLLPSNEEAGKKQEIGLGRLKALGAALTLDASGEVSILGNNSNPSNIAFQIAGLVASPDQTGFPLTTLGRLRKLKSPSAALAQIVDDPSLTELDISRSWGVQNNVNEGFSSQGLSKAASLLLAIVQVAVVFTVMVSLAAIFTTIGSIGESYNKMIPGKSRYFPMAESGRSTGAPAPKQTGIDYMSLGGGPIKSTLAAGANAGIWAANMAVTAYNAITTAWKWIMQEIFHIGRLKYPYFKCVKEGFVATLLSGLDASVDGLFMQSGFANVICREIIKSVTKITSDISNTFFNADVGSFLGSFVSLIDGLRDSKILKIMNEFALTGEQLLSPGNFDGDEKTSPFAVTHPDGTPVRSFIDLAEIERSKNVEEKKTWLEGTLFEGLVTATILESPGLSKRETFFHTNRKINIDSDGKRSYDYKMSWSLSEAPYLLLSSLTARDIGGKKIDKSELRDGKRIDKSEPLDNGPGLKSELLSGKKERSTSATKFDKITPDRVALWETYLNGEYMPFYFRDMRNNQILSFHAFLDSLTDGYSSTYDTQDAIGRVEPIRSYKGTQRKFGLSFYIVATGPNDVHDLYERINALTTMVYPQFTKGKKIIDSTGYVYRQPFSQLPAAPPLVRLKLGDLARSNYSRFDLARLFGFGNDGETYEVARQVIAEPEREVTETLNLHQLILKYQEETRINLEIVTPGDAWGVYTEEGVTTLSALDEKGMGEEAVVVEGGDGKFVEMGNASITGTFKDKYKSIITNGGGDFKIGAQTRIRDLRYVWDKDKETYLNVPMPRHTRSGEIPAVPKGVTELKLTKGNLPKGSTLSRVGRPHKFPNGEFNYSYEGFNYGSEPVQPDSSFQKFAAWCKDKSDAGTLRVKGNTDFMFGKKSTKADPPQDGYTWVGGVIPATYKPSATPPEKPQYFSPDQNVIVRSFENNGGSGLAGFIESLDLDWDLKIPWEVEVAKGPRVCKVSISFSPIHDITPGLDHNGINRAPIY